MLLSNLFSWLSKQPSATRPSTRAIFLTITHAEASLFEKRTAHPQATSVRVHLEASADKKDSAFSSAMETQEHQHQLQQKDNEIRGLREQLADRNHEITHLKQQLQQ